jgi:hypothetical protein
MKQWFVAVAALIVFGLPAAYAATPNKDKPKPATAAQQQNGNEEAANSCRTERESRGVEAFRAKHGTNHNRRNAFGKCVSSKSKDEDENDTDNGKDDQSSGATKACRTERASGAQAFAEKYGTNHNLKNAFGKCVSSKAKAKNKD